MEPLGPILLTRATAFDETSLADFVGADQSGNASLSLERFTLGQFVRGDVVSTFPGGGLARIGGRLIELQLADLPGAGSEIALQVVATDPALKFRLALSDDAPAALQVQLSGKEPPVMTLTYSNRSGGGPGSNSPPGWPNLTPAAIAMLPREQLVSLFEAVARQLLPGSLRDATALADEASSAALQATPMPASAANPAAPPAPDSRFAAFIGWAWPEQAIEVEVDRRRRHDGNDEYLQACVVSVRLMLPHSGRLQTILTWTTPGLRLSIETNRAQTADALRASSGALLDVLSAQNIRVNSLSIRHV